MQNLLDLKNIENLRAHLQNSVKNNLLNLFSLDSSTKEIIANIDFFNSSYSPDLYCMYFSAFAKQKLLLASPTPVLMLNNLEPISIFSIDPLASPADNYIAKNKLARNSLSQLAVPQLPTIAITKSNIIKALNLLSHEHISGLNTKLVNSIAIYDGISTTPTSVSSLYCQGRIYVKNSGDTFPFFYYLDMLVHETAHQHFNIINMHTNLISDYKQNLISYAKNTIRPIYGILHGAFVFHRLIQFYLQSSKLLKAFSTPCVLQDYDSFIHAKFFEIPFNYDFRLKIYQLKLQKTIEQLESGLGLTTAGRDFVKFLKQELFHSRCSRI